MIERVWRGWVAAASRIGVDFAHLADYAGHA